LKEEKEKNRPLGALLKKRGKFQRLKYLKLSSKKSGGGCTDRPHLSMYGISNLEMRATTTRCRVDKLLRDRTMLKEVYLAKSVIPPIKEEEDKERYRQVSILLKTRARC
jgi:hypothetical protein